MDNKPDYNQDIWQEYTPPAPEKKPLPNYDKAALILGIVSAVFALASSCIPCCCFIPLVTGILSIVFVFITHKHKYPWNASRAVALVLSLVSILALILWYVFIVLFMNSPAGEEYMSIFMEEYAKALESAGPYYQ
ncbi:MAG: hypothetical protein IJW18_08585 [Lachnospiraceae bacterium]|nr:hypothetical protein [Lachnospiraceae bacterium]